MPPGRVLAACSRTVVPGVSALRGRVSRACHGPAIWRGVLCATLCIGRAANTYLWAQQVERGTVDGDVWWWWRRHGGCDGRHPSVAAARPCRPRRTRGRRLRQGLPAGDALRGGGPLGAVAWLAGRAAGSREPAASQPRPQTLPPAGEPHVHVWRAGSRSCSSGRRRWRPRRASGGSDTLGGRRGCPLAGRCGAAASVIPLSGGAGG